MHDQADFNQWLEIASNPEKQAGFTPVKAGEQPFKAKGCLNCHTLDGSASTGPTFKDLFGRRTASAGRSKARKSPGNAAGKKAGVIRFRDADGNSWAGRGKRPNWFKAAIASGATPEDLAV